MEKTFNILSTKKERIAIMMLSYIILGKCDISKEKTKTKKTVKEDTDTTTVGRMQFEEWLNEGPRILEKKKIRKRNCDPFAPKINGNRDHYVFAFAVLVYLHGNWCK